MNANRDPNPKRRAAQKKEIDAQKRGDLAEELSGFVKEVMQDAAQFPKDVELDSENPERRVNEEQGTPRHPEVEPKGGIAGSRRDATPARRR